MGSYQDIEHCKVYLIHAFWVLRYTSQVMLMPHSDTRMPIHTWRELKCEEKSDVETPEFRANDSVNNLILFAMYLWREHLSLREAGLWIGHNAHLENWVRSEDIPIEITTGLGQIRGYTFSDHEVRYKVQFLYLFCHQRLIIKCPFSSLKMHSRPAFHELIKHIFTFKPYPTVKHCWHAGVIRCAHELASKYLVINILRSVRERLRKTRRECILKWLLICKKYYIFKGMFCK